MEKLADVSDLSNQKCRVVCDSKGREIALFNIQGQICALENICPHMGGPLGEGDLEGCVVTCPWHGWEFDVRSGECQNMPGESANAIPIVVKDGQVFLLDAT
jgi:nitrite reductase (NADH) small subunit